MLESSVVILSFDHPELTTRAVKSVLDLQLSPKHLYLVHNGSQKKNVLTLKARFPEINHLEIEFNKGYSGGMNVGLAAAFAAGALRVLAVTNDTVLKHWPKAFKIESGHLLREAYLLAPLIERRSTGEVDSLGGEINWLTGKLSHIQTRGLGVAAKAIQDPSFYVPGTSFLMSRGFWKLVGPFDESLGTYWEDVELSLRARLRSAQLGVYSDIKLWHGVGKTCHKNPVYSVFYFHRNRRKVVWKYAPWPERAVFGAIYTVDTARKFFKYVLKADSQRLKLLTQSLIS
ncbi:MAG: glycosyltransferase family 2 protein [Oligoflexia bacterium]|nr:glycosyltransferase family 2 protein [Oligoflexia bacterium]